MSTADAPAPLPAARSRRPWLVVGIIGLLIFAGSYRFVSRFGTEDTDNATIEGHVVTVGARISAQVIQVEVQDGQAVKAGDVMVRLDPSEAQLRKTAAEAEANAAQAALEAADAQIQVLTGSTAASLSGASAGVKSAQAAIDAADEAVRQADALLEGSEARATQAAADRQRAEQLLTTGGVTRQAVDAAISSDLSAQSALAQAKAGAAAARANAVASRERYAQAVAQEDLARTGDAQVQAALAQRRAAAARAAQASAGLETASLQLSYTEIKAPFDGIVARHSAEVGQLLSPGAGVVGLVGTEEVWVVANFKETQVQDMKPGQKVKVEVDSVPGEDFEGKVEAVAPATGARFSLLPPDNASGNFTKVVQRIPVRISLPTPVPAQLRPGESAVVTVYTR